MALDYNLKWNFIKYTEQGRTPLVENRQLKRFLKQTLNLQGTERILDVGCGIGVVGKLLAPSLDFKRGGEVIGIDLDPLVVAYGNKHWARRDGIRLKVGDANHINYSDGSFDMVISLGLLEYVSDPERILSEMLRVLKCPSKLVVIQFDVENLKILPKNEKLETILYDLYRGMRKIGVDLDLTRFHAYCKTQLFPKEEKVTYLKEEYAITEGLIYMMDDVMNRIRQDEGMFHETCEFNFQFLKHVGWTKARVREFIEEKYSTDFYRDHLDETYSQELPVRVYLVHFTE